MRKCKGDIIPLFSCQFIKLEPKILNGKLLFFPLFILLCDKINNHLKIIGFNIMIYYICMSYGFNSNSLKTEK